MTDSTQANMITLPSVLTVGELAAALELPVTKVISELMKNGVMATINEQVDFETAAIIGSDLGFQVEPELAPEPEPVVKRGTLPEGEGQPRPPIVAVMGHVDHGKTSLLDAIRHANVVKGEAGGITQHIGAYQITHNDRAITFLDTPGHEAFSAIRAHGARMTDVAIIVVAADDGVKPQTLEAIRFAREAGVQLVIAINKIDKEGADANRVKQQLSEIDLIPEDWGGQTVMVEVSAKSGQNLEQLLDMVLLVADVEDLRARPEGLADGMVVESHLDTGQGPVATLLIQNGQLSLSDFVVSGDTYGRVRSMTDDRGQRIKLAGPGMPVVISGFKAVPAFGNVFSAIENEKAAREAASSSKRQEQVKSLATVKKIGADELSSAISAGRVQELNVVIKADVQGSLESLLDGLAGLRNEEVAVKVVGSGVGDISESDISLAQTAGAILFGFNVGMGAAVKQLATRERVAVWQYRVIYELLDDIRGRLSDMMAPEIVETELGRLEILGVFKTTKTAVICGGRVTSGKVEPKVNVRVLHEDEPVGEGTLANLQKDKQDAREVVEGEECGLNVATTAGIVLGDTLVFFTRESRARTL